MVIQWRNIKMNAIIRALLWAFNGLAWVNLVHVAIVTLQAPTVHAHSLSWGVVWIPILLTYYLLNSRGKGKEDN